MNRNEKDVLSTNAINAIDRVMVRFVSLTSFCEWIEEKHIDGWGRVKKNQCNKRIWRKNRDHLHPERTWYIKGKNCCNLFKSTLF